MAKNIVGAVSVYQQFIEDYGVTVFSLIAMIIYDNSIYNFSFFCIETPGGGYFYIYFFYLFIFLQILAST